MARVIYGVWNNQVLDNRKKSFSEIPEFEELKNLDSFNEGNAVKAFFGDRGFLVFEKDVNLVEALWRHSLKGEQESCGKCTPCRMGTHLIRENLESVMKHTAKADVWEELAVLADQVTKTSLCGLGQTCAVAMQAAVKYFPDQLIEDAKVSVMPAQHGMSYMTAPCIEACPSNVNVPRYISYLRDGKPTHSLGVILQKYPMAATCGRVCMHFCEMACRRKMVDEAVNIKVLKRFVADHQMETTDPLFTKSMIAEKQPDNMKIAVVGAGPAGVACAYHLLLKGFNVDVLDAASNAGGMAERGIPNYRLPKTILKRENDIVESLGGRYIFNKKLGVDFSIDSLFKDGYKAVFVGIGCAKGSRLGAEGEDAAKKGYEAGLDFLLNVHHHVDGTAPMKVDGDVVVVGGGNVAMDCVRSALRLNKGSKVHLVYRRTKEDMPADEEEIEAAIKEGIICHFLTNPTKVIVEDGVVKGVEVATMRQTEPDDSGRRSVKAIEGSEHVIPCKLLISAIGQQIDREALQGETEIRLNKYGCIDVNATTQETSRAAVFAGGDCTLGPATLIHAMSNGMTAARSIADYLHDGKVSFSPMARMRNILRENKMLADDCMSAPVKSMIRVRHPELSPTVRREMFEEVELSISAQEAYSEARRCMRCYRVYSLITQEKIPEGRTPEIQSPAAP